MDKLKGMVWQGFAAMGLTLIAGAASADEFRGFYAGAGIGSNRVEADGILDDSDTGFKVFAGYSLGEFLAIELAYIDGGKAERTSAFIDFDPASPFQPTLATLRTEVETETINLSVVGNLPLTETFSLIGKLGYASIDQEFTDTFINAFGSASFGGDVTEKEISYGAGAVYSIGKKFQLRAEYEGFDVSEGRLDFFSLSALFRFR